MVPVGNFLCAQFRNVGIAQRRDDMSIYAGLRGLYCFVRAAVE